MLAVLVQLHTWPLLTFLSLNWGTLPGLLTRGKRHRKLGAPTLRSPQQGLRAVPHRQGDSGQAGTFLRKRLLWVWCGRWHQGLGPKEQAWESQG